MIRKHRPRFSQPDSAFGPLLLALTLLSLLMVLAVGCSDSDGGTGDGSSTDGDAIEGDAGDDDGRAVDVTAPGTIAQLRVALPPSATSAAVAVGIDQGVSAGGVELVEVRSTGERDAVEALTSGSVDLAVLSVPVILRSFENGADFTIVGGGARATSGSVAIVTPDDVDGPARVAAGLEVIGLREVGGFVDLAAARYFSRTQRDGLETGRFASGDLAFERYTGSQISAFSGPDLFRALTDTERTAGQVDLIDESLDGVLMQALVGAPAVDSEAVLNWWMETADLLRSEPELYLRTALADSGAQDSDDPASGEISEAAVDTAKALRSVPDFADTVALSDLATVGNLLREGGTDIRRVDLEALIAD